MGRRDVARDPPGDLERSTRREPALEERERRRGVERRGQGRGLAPESQAERLRQGLERGAELRAPGLVGERFEEGLGPCRDLERDLDARAIEAQGQPDAPIGRFARRARVLQEEDTLCSLPLALPRARAEPRGDRAKSDAVVLEPAGDAARPAQHARRELEPGTHGGGTRDERVEVFARQTKRGQDAWQREDPSYYAAAIPAPLRPSGAAACTRAAGSC